MKDMLRKAIVVIVAAGIAVGTALGSVVTYVIYRWIVG
jgi:hypothetical protein